MSIVYAATERCRCGAGLAYRDNADPYNGAWRCSLELLGEAEPHAPMYPFRWHVILPEDLPSARGKTTRPTPVQTDADSV